MPGNPIAGHPSWRQLLVILVALPIVVVAAVLAYAWPAGRIAPRSLPVGVVGPARDQVVAGLDRAQPGGFHFRSFADEAAARTAVRDRDVYGAFVVGRDRITVLEASAASPTVAQLLTAAGQKLATRVARPASGIGSPGPAVRSRTVDVVPISRDDPRGVVISSALLPLTICSVIIAAAIAVVCGFRPAALQIAALGIVSAATGAGAFLIAQSLLGALPHEHLATLGALALMLLALSATTAGLYSLAGTPGLVLSALLMVFVGNPFSGVTSAPELLPGAVQHIGEWLPPGAGAELLRSTAYFHGNGSTGHLLVLVSWTAFGLAAVATGQHTSVRFAGHADHDAAGAPTGGLPTETEPATSVR
jgi:hypothetical protein